MNATIQRLVRGDELSLPESKRLFDDLFDGDIDEADVFTLLAALNTRAETASEIAGAIHALRSAMETSAAPRLPASRIATVGRNAADAILDIAVALTASELGFPTLLTANDPLDRNARVAAYRALEVPVCTGRRDGLDALRRDHVAAVFDRQLRTVERQAVGADHFDGSNILDIASTFAGPVRASHVLCEVPEADLCAPLARALALIGVRSGVVFANVGPAEAHLARLTSDGRVDERAFDLPVPGDDIRHHALPNDIAQGVAYVVGENVVEEFHHSLAYRTGLLAVAGDIDESFEALYGRALKLLRSGLPAERLRRMMHRPGGAPRA